jgi:hypothetical protein
MVRRNGMRNMLIADRGFLLPKSLSNFHSIIHCAAFRILRFEKESLYCSDILLSSVGLFSGSMSEARKISTFLQTNALTR